MDWFTEHFAALHQWLFEALVQPAMFSLGLMSYAELAFEGIEWLLWGCLEIAVLYLLLRPLEALRPVERWTDRSAVRTDVLYTLLARLGLLPLLFFALLSPLENEVQSWLRMHDVIPPNLEDWFPVLNAHPLLSTVAYVAIIDFSEYWRHRLSHKFDWWWALHSLHHSQQQLTFWSDDRNHLLDDLIAGFWSAGVALLIGIPPGQFILIVIATRMVESLSHANIRLSFGAWGERLLVSPRFHRIHHAIGTGHEGTYQGCNFSILFPLWDMLFGTANFDHAFPATGISDQLEGRDYGRGFIAQQVLGVKRLLLSLMPQTNR